MTTSQTITKKYPSTTEWNATKIFTTKRNNIAHAVQFVQETNRLAGTQITINSKDSFPLSTRPQWRDKEYRQAYMEAAIEQGVAWQVKINRKFRGLSQKQLATAIGTQQSAISRLEDPEYGAHSLETLTEIAQAFDCALLVKFISYSDLAKESEMLSETDQYAVPYSLDIEQYNG
jgi:transcriptional regulator with XRE-family HTH domain